MGLQICSGLCDRMEHNRHLFAFDIGTNSLGWSVIGLDHRGQPASIVDCGVRIFSKIVNGRLPKPASEVRRVARRASRRRDKFLRRRKALARTLVEFGLLPRSERDYKRLVDSGNDRPGQLGLSPLDPFVLRCRGLRHRLELHEIGRAIMHMGKRRGRKISGQKSVTIPPPALFLAKRRVDGDPVRYRTGGLCELGNQPNPPRIFRHDLEGEFRTFWAVQSRFHPAQMTGKRGDLVARLLFHERLWQAPDPGYCSLEHSEPRVLRDHPDFIRFRLLKSVNELRLEAKPRPRKLTLVQRNQILRALRKTSFLGFTSIRKLANLPDNIRFTAEKLGRRGLLGGKPDPRYAPGRCRFGTTALRKLIPFLEKSVVSEAEARQAAGYLHRADYCRKNHDRLPPYGEILFTKRPSGECRRHPNDRIHVALNQLRRVCNLLLQVHGKPCRIAVESARDFKAGPDELLSANLLMSEKARQAKLRRVQMSKALAYHAEAADQSADDTAFPALGRIATRSKRYTPEHLFRLCYRFARRVLFGHRGGSHHPRIAPQAARTWKSYPRSRSRKPFETRQVTCRSGRMGTS